MENEPMVHVENDPKVNDNSVDENPANKSYTVKALPVVKLLMKTMLYCCAVQHVHGNQ